MIKMTKIQQDIDDQISLVRHELKEDLREIVESDDPILRCIDRAPLHDLVLLSQELCRNCL